MIVFYDINKAFDSSSHVNILYNLYNKGIKGKMFKWLYDFLSNRSCKFCIGYTISDEVDKIWSPTRCYFVSPPVLILLLNPPQMSNVHTRMYADDLSLFVIDDDIDSALNVIY